jgi:transcriptional regulator with XRE-family HTH domain
MIQTLTLLNALKKAFKANGMTYAELAKRLQISEASVKRAFSGKSPLTLDRLEEIANILGVGFLDLAREAFLSEDLPRQLKPAQEDALALDPKLHAFFYLVLKGLPVDEICASFRFTAHEAEGFLLKLDKLSLIELFPNNRVRCRVSPFIHWRKGGPLDRLYADGVKSEFFRSSFTSEDEFLVFATAQLTPRSLREFRERFDRIIRDIRETTEVEHRTAGRNAKPCIFIAGGRPFIPEFIEKLRRK